MKYFKGRTFDLVKVIPKVQEWAYVRDQQSDQLKIKYRKKRARFFCRMTLESIIQDTPWSKIYIDENKNLVIRYTKQG